MILTERDVNADVKKRQLNGSRPSKNAAGMRTSKRKFAELVEQALSDIPAPLAEYMRDLTVDVESVPDSRTCRDADVDDAPGLLGLYRGTPLTSRSVEQDGNLPDRITIYQRNIERMCSTRAEIIREIRRTVFHEVGHHFGLDEDDLAALGYE